MDPPTQAEYFLSGATIPSCIRLAIPGNMVVYWYHQIKPHHKNSFFKKLQSRLKYDLKGPKGEKCHRPARFSSFHTPNLRYACPYLLTISVYLPYLSHSRQYKVKKRIHWDPRLYEMTTTCDYRFLWRPQDSKLSILDEVVAVFRLTTPQFLALHPPLVYSRSFMAQLAAT